MLALVAAVALQPAWFDSNIAGYAFAYDSTHSPIAVYDPVRKYYVMREVECDGGVLELTLTKDRNVMADYGFFVPNFQPKDRENGTRTVTVKPISSLRTGKGVAIGDSIAAVRKRLGKGGHLTKEGRFVNLVYSWRNRADAQQYEERYTFKGGALIEIQFSRNSGEEYD